MADRLAHQSPYGGLASGILSEAGPVASPRRVVQKVEWHFSWTGEEWDEA